MNSYDVLRKWGEILSSCETEEQFKNALNVYPQYAEACPCIDDAW